jgi:plastocyanin
MRTSLSTVLLIAAVAVGCSSSTDGSDTGGSSPGAAAVSIGDNFFNPAQVTVDRVDGQAKVTWTWSGNNQHNVTFDAGGPNSVTQSTGTFSRTFMDAGSFTYICTIHGRAVMSGTVQVQ